MHLPKYPIYIISKGRWDSRQTQKTCEELKLPYRIVIEESEYDKYAENVPKSKILVLPSDFRNDPKYAIPVKEVSDKVGGSIPVRNWVWEHSIKEGHKRHWIWDDNMRHIYRLHKNQKIRMETGTPIRVFEEFVDRYENVKMAGLQYDFFCPRYARRPPYYVNTRVYSCILLSNDIPMRWRGLYNEDTDLSLQILKAGWCSILSNQFLVGKTASMTMKGGNTSEVYKIKQAGDKYTRSGDEADEHIAEGFDNRKEFAESLRAAHPEHVAVLFRKDLQRWHHHVNFGAFVHQLKKKEGLNIPKGPNEWGMKKIRIDGGKTPNVERY
tara:strand:- start:1717 stop:2691 length:975 start_codon:yes stop_codon:yes gene_type:complete